MTYAVETERLTKVFYPPRGLLKLVSKSPLKRELTAVKEANLKVREGEIFGLLGPNGAGKTTLIKMLCTLIRPTSGRALINGIDVLKDEEKVKWKVGLVTADERSFFWRLTGRENLEFFASLHGIQPKRLKGAIDEVISEVGLSEASDNMFYSFSSGMKQKLSIARALLTDPKILFLDEPTRSLDPIMAQYIKDLIKRRFAGERGMTVFLSTHRLEEAEQICDRIAIMDSAEVVFVGSVGELKSKVNREEGYRKYPTSSHYDDQSSLEDLFIDLVKGGRSS